MFFRGRPGVGGGGRDPLRADPAGEERSTRQNTARRPRRRCATIRRPPATRRHAGALPARGPDRLIDERMGKLENRSLADDLSPADHAHRDRRATTRATPSCSTTPMSAATPWWRCCAQLFRLPPNGKPMTIMQLAGFPAEVVDSVVSVLLPHGVRFRAVERRRVPAAVRLRGGAPLRAGRPQRSASARPARRSRASPRKAANTACSSAWSRSARPSSTPPSSRNAARCSPCAWRTTATRRSSARRSSDAAAALLGVRALARHPRGVRVRRGRGAADAAASSSSCPRSSFRRARWWAPPRRFVAGIDPDFIGSVLERWRGADHEQPERARRCDGFRIAGANQVLDPRPAGALDRAVDARFRAARVRAAHRTAGGSHGNAGRSRVRGSTRTASAC